MLLKYWTEKRFNNFLLLPSNNQLGRMGKTSLFSFTLFSVLLHLTYCSYTQPSRGTDYTLGKNLISNPQITIPVISPSVFASFKSPLYGWYDNGSSIEYIDACININYGGICPTYKGVTCGWQFLDTDSYRFN